VDDSAMTYFSRNTSQILVELFLILFCIFRADRLVAHNASTSYISINTKGGAVSGSLKLDVLDAHRVVGLDSDFDGQITWREVKASKGALSDQILKKLKFEDKNGEKCSPGLDRVTAEQKGGTYFLMIYWNLPCFMLSASPLSFSYHLLFDIDRSHMGIVTVDQGSAIILKEGDPPVVFDGLPPSVFMQFTRFLKQGIWHIFIGYDHILFIITLIISVLKTTNRGYLLGLIRVVSAFTIAHSVTLFLVGTGLLSLPSQFVESVIALSIILGALNNLYQFLPGSIPTLAFVFGLIHGFGFAGVLNELSPSVGGLVTAVLSFNFGVELGQVAIIAAVMPLILLSKKWGFFDFWIYKWGSFAVSIVGLIWLFERVTSVSIF
jgi:hypothetical protein